MSGHDVSASVLAEVDQDRAELAALVTAAREHTDATACEHRGVCAGEVVASVLDEMGADELQALLSIAVAELAERGYGLALYPTDAALAALDRPEGGDDDNHR